MSRVDVNWNVFNSVSVWIDQQHVVNLQTDLETAKSIGEGLVKLDEPERTDMAHMIRDVLWKQVNPNAKEKHND